MNFHVLFSICAICGTTSVVCGLCWKKSLIYRALALMSLFVMTALLYCVWAPQQ